MAEITGLDALLQQSKSSTVGLDAILLPPNVRRRLTVGLNLRLNAPYQWNRFDFNSMTIFNGVPIGSNEDGIFSLFDADADNGGQIDSFFEFPTTDLGEPNAKKMRKLHVSLESSGAMIFKSTVDDFDEKSFLMAPKMTGQKQHRAFTVGMRRDQKGVYWGFRMENVAGCDFSVDKMTFTIYSLGMGR